jgi:hypothetical protein
MLALVALAAALAAPSVGCDPLATGAAEPDRDRDVVAGPLAIIAARTTPGERREAFNGHGYKLPVTLPAGGDVTVSAPRGVGLVFRAQVQDRVWRRGVRAADRTLRFRACPDGGRTGWPGGIVVDRPRCATLVVRVAGATTIRRRVPLGRHC